MTLEPPFVDGRGEIQSLVEGQFSRAQMITSRAEAIRASYYHTTDWHYGDLIRPIR